MPKRLSNHEMERYSRHIHLPGIGIEGQLKIKLSSALLIGVGGLGSPISQYLIAAGIGRLGIIDSDVVDLSNLQRQTIHRTQDQGLSKVESARRFLNALNPHCQIDVYYRHFDLENGSEIAAPYDILIDGSDNLLTRYLINEIAVQQGKPYIYGAIYQFEGQVSVFDARQGPCYQCLFDNPPEKEPVKTQQDLGVFGAIPGIVGSLQTTEVLKLILELGEPLIGKLLMVDTLTMQTQIVKIKKNEACPICGSKD
ncbi:MAG: HesA/MoeB/ThiF family protein [Anaerolineaceae bacterium]|nr:HesA/MoeB/ThiF family protein [Anaerolineaceae bacterium]